MSFMLHGISGFLAELYWIIFWVVALSARSCEVAKARRVVGLPIFLPHKECMEVPWRLLMDGSIGEPLLEWAAPSN